MACLTDDELKNLQPTTRVLEIGCGQKKLWPQSIAMDVNPRSVADVIHDLNVFPYPFESNSFDIVIAEHVLEHLPDLIKPIEEIHRILKPGGLLYVEVPHFSSHHFQTDPTHKIRFGVRTFDYFEPAQGGVYLFHYSYADFKKRRVIVNGSNRSRFHRWMTRIVNNHKLGWERDLAWIFPQDSINFELEALKQS